MALLIAPALLAPLPPPRGASEEALSAWRMQISNFLESLAFALEEVGDAYVAETSQITEGLLGTLLLADASVTTAKLANVAVTTAKTADASQTVDKLAADAVSTVKLQDAAVTLPKIAANVITTDVFGSGGPTAFGSTETQLTSVILSPSTGKAQIFSSVLFDTTAVVSQTVTYRVRKDSITGTVLRSATVSVQGVAGAQISHTIRALDAAPATSQTYLITAQASAGSAVVARDHELLATGFHR